MRFAAFDLEIAAQAPDNLKDLRDFGRLGITCAAVACSDMDEVKTWHDAPWLSQETAREVVRHLQGFVEAGYVLLTWNGCKFDFAVLADESDLATDCARLALNHVDLMLLVTFQKGYYLSLEKVLRGAGLKGKLKEVALKDGTRLVGMSGADAPVLWARGEYEAVLAYLRQDVAMPVQLAQWILKSNRLQWLSNSGKPQMVEIGRLLTVEECFSLPEPDVSWMSDPPRRHDFVRWMPMGIAACVDEAARRAPVA